MIRADAFSAARVISAVSAGYNEALSGKPSTIPAEAKARTTKSGTYAEALKFFRAHNPGKLSEETINKIAHATAAHGGLIITEKNQQGGRREHLPETGQCCFGAGPQP